MDLLHLNDYYRKASLGYDYHYLRTIYPKWSCELHKDGNTMDNDKLQTIGIQGIMLWYCENICHLPVTYNFTNIEKFISSPEKITYYDFKNIYVLIKYLNLNVKQLERFDFKQEYKYSFLLDNYVHNNYKINKNIMTYFIKPFGFYIIDLINKDFLVNILNKCNDYIKEHQYWFKKNNIFDTFFFHNQVINNWVIIFLKFKIVVEKMRYQKHKDIYKIDSFVEIVQQLLYSITVYYYNNFIINNTEPIVINDEIIKKIENIELLKPIENFDICNELICN